HDLPLFEDLLILLVTSIPIAFISNRLRLPVIVAFMITGILMGPYGLALINDVHAVEALAEIGVVLLLFTIGLEFSLRRILEMRRMVFGGGALQVTLTVMLTTFITYQGGRRFGQAIFFGFLVALSSTAIVLKSYMDRAELDSPHGKAGVGILLFQDLCVVPMMLLVPALSGKEGSSTAKILLTLGGAFVAIAIILFTARKVIPYLLRHIVRLRSPEIFIIFIVLVSLGTSWLTAQFGLSLALGAFIAGLVLSESEYSHQIVADILPFRDVFNSIFFISIGMLLSLGFLAANVLAVMAWVVGLLAVKALIGLLAVRLMGNSLRVSTMAAVGLAQVGEFSFILAKVGVGQELLTDGDYQTFLAAAIISMIATPFMIKVAPRLGYRVQSWLSPDSVLEPTMMGYDPGGEKLKGHIIIVGYGLNGRNLSKVLRRIKIPYAILDLNAETVRKAAVRDGEPITYGDATRKEVLHRLNLEHARIIVLATSDPIATRRTVALAREMNPDIHIIVRTRYMAELSDLYKLGADQVIPEEFETSIEIFSRVLREYGVARNVIQGEVEEIRREGYQMLRDHSLPLVEMSAIGEALGSASTETLFIDRDSPAIGKTIGEMDLRKQTGATLITAIRDGNTEINPGPDYKLEAEDILVLLGSPEQIEMAIEQINDAGAGSGGAGAGASDVH
ncbi:MAG TPA: cation:proton antiporter, partial [Blastocatellia bacterium]|nr:cation:proton antiporter [Blastocatellia bacterium]